jgi:hypothetical protein
VGDNVLSTNAYNYGVVGKQVVPDFGIAETTGLSRDEELI